MQRRATANPSTDGIAASHRQRAAPAVSTRKPSHPGSSQNHSAKKAPPTASAAAALIHFSRRSCSRRSGAGAPLDCVGVIVRPSVADIISLSGKGKQEALVVHTIEEEG